MLFIHNVLNAFLKCYICQRKHCSIKVVILSFLLSSVTDKFTVVHSAGTEFLYYFIFTKERYTPEELIKSKKFRISGNKHWHGIRHSQMGWIHSLLWAVMLNSLRHTVARASIYKLNRATIPESFAMKHHNQEID